MDRYDIERAVRICEENGSRWIQLETADVRVLLGTKVLCDAKDNETTVRPGVPVHDFVDERGWMWRYDDRENLDVW